MTHINRKDEPRPKKNYLRPVRIAYSIDRAIVLNEPRRHKIDFFQVLQMRRSSQGFTPLTSGQLADFLGYAMRTTEVRLDSTGWMWQHRTSASAGGIHPVDTFVLNFPPGNQAIYYYDPFGHTLKQLAAQHSKPLHLLRRYALKMKNEPNAVVIWFAAQGHLTAAKYHNAESLVWRDSGSLVMTSYLVATALRLKCCALGITGRKYFSELGKGKRRVEGVGGVLLGA